MQTTSPFKGEVGLQFVLSVATHYTTRELVELAEYAREAGFDQVWIDDVLGHRNQFITMSAIAAKSPMKLGTAVMVPYFRHPADIAGALASISELIHPHELSVGIARGGAFPHRQLPQPKPITMLAETAQFLKRLLAGEALKLGEFPFLTSYFHMNPEASFQMAFVPKAPVRLYCGGNSPKSLAVGGRFMDGILFGGPFIMALRTGRMQQMLAIAEGAAREADPNKRLRNVAEINLSLSIDLRAAIQFAKPYVVNMLRRAGGAPGTIDDFVKVGVDPDEISRVTKALEKGATREEAVALVPDAMVDAIFIAGDLNTCQDRIAEACQAAADLGIAQVSFAKLGPDCREAIRLLSRDILPMLKRP